MSQTVYKYTFKVGDVVRWSSQAGGFSKEKKGTVIEVVPADRHPEKYDTTSSRRHETYVVEVDRPSSRKSHAALKPEVYWPVRSQLAPAKARKSGGSKPKKVVETDTAYASRPKHSEAKPGPNGDEGTDDKEATDDANVRDQRVEDSRYDDDIEGDD